MLSETSRTLSGGVSLRGRVVALSGLAVEIAGLGPLLSIGDRVSLEARGGKTTLAEIVGFRSGHAQAVAFGGLGGIGPGSRVEFALRESSRSAFGNGATLPVDDRWIGRVIDPLGRPLDGKGPLPTGIKRRAVRAAAPVATARGRLGDRVDLGVRALDVFTTCRSGQRLGVFAGSGVGKSTLLGMMARSPATDVAVIALVGERGREVREFIEDELGADGLAKAVVVVATSDSPPLMRREAALAAMTVAEHFAASGRSVRLLMDSVTRFCLALREIGLAAGEPPATRGYPPSVFAELPRLLERAGPAAPPGQITAFFTVLVEGDDLNEPVADAVRGILDGHVVLDRNIAESGRYPAVNVLKSLSRSVPGCNSDQENAMTARARAILALHADMADLVRLGAYRPGSDPRVDEAIALAPRIEAMLRQGRYECSTIGDGFTALEKAMSHEP